MIGFVFLFCLLCPAQGATGDLVLLGPIFKWFPLCEFSLFDTPQQQFSGSLGSWSHCFHSKAQGLISDQERRLHKWFVMALSEIKTNIQKRETKDEPQTNGNYKIRQIIIKNKGIHTHTHTHTHTYIYTLMSKVNTVQQK